MIQIESSSQVSRPRDEVFDFLADVTNLPKWQAGVIDSKPVSQGAARVGFQFAEVVRVGPWKLDTLCTVTDFKPNERFGFEVRSSGPIECDAYFDLQPMAGGTRLTLNGKARLKGLWRLMQPLLARELRKETEIELATIKLLLEAAAAAQSPVTARQVSPAAH